MSVTFFPTEAPAIGWTVTHFDGGKSAIFADRAKAVALLVARQESQELLPGSQPDEAYGLYEVYSDGLFVEPVTTDGDDAPSLNVSNQNARALLAVLGVDTSDGLLGTLPADDLLGRVLVAQALNPADPGIPAQEHYRNGRVVAVECGRPAGYVDHRLDQLRALAQWAAAHGRDVHWS